MGRVLLIWRLVAGDIRRRPVQAALLLVVILASTATLTLGLALRHVAQSPFGRTRAATRGPDVVAEIQPAPHAHIQPARTFAGLERAPGVSATAGPFPLAFVRLTAPGANLPVIAEGRTAAAETAALNRPVLTAGSWARTGGVVLEQGLARTLRLRVGSRIQLDGRGFTVSGVALETEQAFYPACTPGLVWVTPSATHRLASTANPLGYELDLGLRHPSAAAGFQGSAAGSRFATGLSFQSAIIQTWQGVRHDDFEIIAVDQRALLIGSWLLAMLALASIAVLVGGRMAEQTRRVGLLKAIGATPRLVAFVLLAENLLLSAAGGLAGLLAGRLLLPSFSNPGQGLLGTPPLPPLTAAIVAEVILVAIVVAGAATVLPAIHGARTSTLRALVDQSRPPRRHRRLTAFSARLPVPLLLGLRIAARRPRRTALTAAALTIAVTMVVAALTIQHQVDVRQQANTTTGLFRSADIGGRISHLVLTLGAVLVVLGGLNAVFASWATAIDSRRSTALARALGATPRDVVAGLTAAQLLPGLFAAALGIPAGLALYRFAGGHGLHANPPLPLLLAVLVGTLAVVAVLTSVPAWVGARRSVAAVLRSD